jgi:Nif-specific regulatory protein
MAEPVQTYHEAVAAFKREVLRHALTAHGGNRTRAARALGLQRTYLLRLIRDLHLNIPRSPRDYRAREPI